MAHDDRFADFNARQRQHADDERRALDLAIEMACPECGRMVPVGALVTTGCPICDVEDDEE